MTKNMGIFSKLYLEILFTVIFAVSLTFTVYYLQNKQLNKVIFFGLIAWFSIGLAIAIYVKRNLVLEREFSGFLIPAEKPTPKTELLHDVPPEAYKLLLGNSGVAWTTQLPLVVAETDQGPLLTIDKKPHGISITAKIYSDDNKIVSEIVNNEWHVNPNNYFRKERPNKSTLVVFDQRGHEVLNIYYLNRTTFKLVGVFPSPGKKPLIIEENYTRIPGVGVLRNFNFGECKVAIRF